MTTHVGYSDIDGWYWEIRVGGNVTEAGTGYSREDCVNRLRLALKGVYLD